jgi:hypothetical protein
MRRFTVIFWTGLLLYSNCAHFKYQPQLIKPTYDYRQYSRAERDIHRRVEKFILHCWQTQQPVALYPQVRIAKVEYLQDQRLIGIHFNAFWAYNPYRPKDITAVYQEVRKYLGWRYRKATLSLYCQNQPIEQLVPNIYRTNPQDYDLARFPKIKERPLPVVRNLSRPLTPNKGLNGFNIALWASHGWYFNQRMSRWEWQRPRLFETVEDLLPNSFVLPFLLPMLENAGAITFIPRERDIQTNEVIVDNDGSTGASIFQILGTPETTVQIKGFGIGNPPYPVGVNPFNQGSSLKFLANNFDGKIQWIPDIPAAGEYAVYVAYQRDSNNVADAHYAIYHTGGKTEFAVNQQIGGGTWIYLGKFKFQAGLNPEKGRVELTVPTKSDQNWLSVDAVRFGGGMGNISRGGTVSNRPRFVEGARYYLQYAGFPDTLVFSLNAEQDDYVDDYQCRGEWVNYLNGRPCGPNKQRNHPGLGIPIDLSLSFHTDAGIAFDDIIGTLAIYSVEDYDSALVFPDSVSRYVNRDLADIIQTQIVDDIKTKWDPGWKRRHLFNRQYSEAFRPNVPAMLLELLSHQNFLDMQYALDPRFRFDVARSIYKGMLKFLAFQHQREYVVQPLPISHFSATLTEAGTVKLSWQPVADPLEPTAKPTQYVIYTRIEDNGFNNGVVVNTNSIIIRNLEPGVIYSFKVTAANAGGESFPSEILAVCYQATNPKPVLIVNGFDRVAPPAVVNSPEFSGVVSFLDQGVPYLHDLNHTGKQHDFNRQSPWVTNDRPGWGASYANYETTLIPGNTFDFVIVHGQALRAAGYSFASASDEAVWDKHVNLLDYSVVDLILGEEKKTTLPRNPKAQEFKAFPNALQAALTNFCKAGGNLFVSGSYIGTDLYAAGDSLDIKFARNVLHFNWVTSHAATTGKVVPVNEHFGAQSEILTFNSAIHPTIYTVEAPDALEPLDSLGSVFLRYAENQFSAGVAYRGKNRVIAIGFPFESIIDSSAREKLMLAVLKFFQE